MAKKVRKVNISNAPVPTEVRSAVRAFFLSHRDGHSDEDLKDLRMYIEAYHDMRFSSKQLEALIREEMTNIAVEMKAKHMEEELFAPNENEKRVYLGSCFCPRCSRFKNYKKECPHCEHHEMTV
ncbi:MAG: hypothetical protein ACMUHY_01240 [Thermoplasmatota archaeon]